MTARLPGGRLFIGILGACAATAFAAQMLLEVREGENEPGLRAALLFAAAVVALGCALVAALGYRARNGRDRKRLIELDVRDLPFAGRGPDFAAAVAGSTFAFSLMAHLGEGAFDRGDVVGWLLCAVVLAVCTALAAASVARAIPAVAALLDGLRLRADAPSPRFFAHRRSAPRIAYGDAWPPTLFNRPPPLHA